MSKQKQLPVSPAALANEDTKQDSTPLLPNLLPKQGGTIEIAPIETLNEWVVLVPFNIETNLILSADTQYRNIGVVVGKSKTVLAPSGERVASALEYGMTVLFQKKSVVGEMSIDQHPYQGRRLIILSERNIVCRLPAVPVKILSTEIGSESFLPIQPE